MPSREEQWTDLMSQYERGILRQVPCAAGLAAACEVLRDSSWASDLYPWSSVGRLGLSSTPIYEEALERRAVWFSAAAEGNVAASFQERFGSIPVRTENLPDLSEKSLSLLASWVRGNG